MPVSVFPGIETHFNGRDYGVLDVGAQPIAWTPAGQLPVLWLSPLADFEPGKGVRGGVPIVFPWFGNGPDGDRRPKHGFARTAAWRRVQVTENVASAGQLVARYELGPDDLDHTDGSAVAAEWPFAAELVATMTDAALTVSLAVTNTGTEPITYEAALHTYLKVCDVSRVSITGLEGCSYTDTVGGALTRGLQTEPVRFEGEVDRIYDCAGSVVVDDPGFSRRIRVTAHGAANTVVWNPGRALGTSMADVGQYWSEFVCVESGNVRSSAVRLSAGEQHTLSQHVGLI